MAVYKVPQDVEAEDKLLGPFTFKQFIFLIVGLLLAYVAFLLASIQIFLALIPAPLSAALIFLAVYSRKDQPMEAYLIARIRFMFKPHKRLWDKDGQIEHVHINIPKKIERIYSDGRSASEVKSSLKNLAQIMDTRGWSSKNVLIQEANPDIMSIQASDRLVAPGQISQDPMDIHDSDDYLDASSAVYQNFNTLTSNSSASAREQAIANMKARSEQLQQQTMTQSSAQTNDDDDIDPNAGFANQSPAAAQTQANQSTQTSSADDSQIIDQEKTSSSLEEKDNTSTMTQSVPPDIIRLSQDNNRSVSSIAKEADDILHDNESISLH